MKQIMVDSSTLSTLILILKKVHRFLFKFLSMHERKLWKKKMIDVYTVNKRKKKPKTNKKQKTKNKKQKQKKKQKN